MSEKIKHLLAVDSPYNETGIGLSIVTLTSTQKLTEFEDARDDMEYQVIILSGRGYLISSEDNGRQPQRMKIYRRNIFDTMPYAFSFSANTPWALKASDGSHLEVAIVSARNKDEFPSHVLSPGDISDEERGEGKLDGVMHRKVRAIFGDPMASLIIPESQLVVGEVVNEQGRWSSYPPHYHKHPEAYYYKFDKPNGFGVAMLMDSATSGEARIVKEGDVLQIVDCNGHPQTSAPGYRMWYLWMIRHLPDNRYEGNPPFIFFPEHEWVNK